MNPATNTGETAVLIHGTGAQDPEDEGSLWWQIGSEFSQRLSGCLVNSNVKVNKQVFHWSGANSEVERQAAGQDLFLKWIQRFERERQPYHLIGHSHGGSVIWAALQRAARRGDKLRYLRSWATVGTPFMHYRWKIGPAALLVLMTRLAIVVPGLLVTLWVLFLTIDPAIFALARNGGGLVPAEQFGRELLEGWTSLKSNARLFVLLASLLGTLAWAGFVGTLSASFGLSRVSRGVRKTMTLYGDRWMGLFSRYDEAIHGLKRTTEIPDPKGLVLFPRITWARTRIRNIRAAGGYWRPLPWLLLLLLLTSGLAVPLVGLLALANNTVLAFGLLGVLIAAHVLLVLLAAAYAFFTPGYNVLSRWRARSRAQYWPIIYLLWLGAPVILLLLGIVLGHLDWLGAVGKMIGTIAFLIAFCLPLIQFAVILTYCFLVSGYNIAAAFLDRCFVDIAGRCLQGNDAYTTALASEVSTGPLPSGELPSLPVEVDDYLKCKADEKLKDFMPIVREMLGQYSFLPLIRGLPKKLSWKELIHNCYFDSGDVVKLLAMHIDEKSSVNSGTAEQRTVSTEELRDWRANFQTTVKNALADLTDRRAP